MGSAKVGSRDTKWVQKAILTDVVRKIERPLLVILGGDRDSVNVMKVGVEPRQECFLVHNIVLADLDVIGPADPELAALVTAQDVLFMVVHGVAVDGIADLGAVTAAGVEHDLVGHGAIVALADGQSDVDEGAGLDVEGDGGLAKYWHPGTGVSV